MKNEAGIGDVIETYQLDAMRGIFNRFESWLLAEYDQFIGEYRLEDGYLMVRKEPDGEWTIAQSIPVAIDCGIWQRTR